MAFLTEILSFIGLEGKGGGFDGGIGEAQFHSFLRENYAKAIVESGGLSLAEHFAESIEER
ncbi:rod-binding protein [Litoreibacter janthinus]|nr:rod-binding protein [Litoreibacter janthinus]